MVEVVEVMLNLDITDDEFNNDISINDKINNNPIKYLTKIIKKGDDLITDKKFNEAIDMLRKGEEIYDVNNLLI